MSLSKFVGRCTILGLIIYLFVKGALILRPRETVAALSALIAAQASACCGGTSEPAPPTIDIRVPTSSCPASPLRSGQRTRGAAAETRPPDARASPA